MSTQLVRLAAAVLSSEKGRKTVGWVLAAILKMHMSRFRI